MIDISFVERTVILNTKVQLYNTINISSMCNTLFVTLCYYTGAIPRMVPSSLSHNFALVLCKSNLS